MEKLTFVMRSWVVEVFSRVVSCSVWGAVFGASAAVAGKPVEKPGFVVINGWVLPSRYFRNASV